MILKKLAIFLATGLYVGYSPFAPGTFGTLLGVIICYLLSSLKPSTYGIVLFFSFIIAVWVSSIATGFFSKKDPGQIVCDEVVGYMVAFFLIPFTLLNAIIVFLLFRFFDIVKPFPIRTIDERMDNSAGIVLDDVLAGIYSNIVFHFISKFVAL